MTSGRVLSSRQFIEVVRMLLGGLPDMSSADAQWLIVLPGVERKIQKLINSLLPEEGPAYGTDCDGTDTWADLLLKGNITFGGCLGNDNITPHPKEQVIVQLLRRDESSPVPLALAELMIQSRGAIRACNPEEMLSWIARNWNHYLKPLNQSIVFPDPGRSGLEVSVILRADENGNPALGVEINRKEWDPGTYFAVVVR